MFAAHCSEDTPSFPPIKCSHILLELIVGVGTNHSNQVSLAAFHSDYSEANSCL